MVTYIGEIRLFPYAAALTSPLKWERCDGQVLSTGTYPTLFALIGTTYGSSGGPGTYNLPDLRGRVPIHSGTGTGLAPRIVGVQLGKETESLSITQIPAHTHNVSVNNTLDANTSVPGYNGVSSTNIYHTTPNATLATTSVGSGASHNNMQPSLVLNYYINATGGVPPT